MLLLLLLLLLMMMIVRSRQSKGVIATIMWEDIIRRCSSMRRHGRLEEEVMLRVTRADVCRLCRHAHGRRRGGWDWKGGVG